jgi:acetyl esterase/lipase
MARRKCELGLWLACCSLGASGGVVPAPLYAETRTAADLTPEAVGKAIDAAEDGDIVQLPAGTAVWSKRGWHTGHSPRVKAITIRGAGIDKTIITVDKSKSGNAYFELEGVEGKPFRVTGITLDGSLHPDEASWGALMSIGGTCKNFRIDHCKFKNSDVMLMIDGGGDRGTYGLVDHCCFDGQLSHGGCLQPICYSGPGAPNYRKPLTLGTAQAMYFEDDEVNLGGAVATGDNPFIVAINAARVVIRHNKIVNAEIEIYGPGQRKYGCQTSEIYDNQFATVDGGRPGGFIFIAAGAAIVFNNTVTGATYDCRVIQLTNHRAFMEMPPWGKADGKNPLDGNRIPAGQVGAGYPCFGQVGWATNVDGVFKPSPCYAWNNTFNGAKVLMAVGGNDPNQAAQIKEGRDFFNGKPPAEYYTPYVYPHPLQHGWEALMKCAAGFAGAKPKVHRGLPYAQPGSELQTLDVYAPAEGENLPVVVWIHGGGWHRGDKSEMDKKPQAMVDKGFVFVSVNYRLFPAVTIKQIAADVAKAIRWTREHIREYGGDPSAIVVMGHSAGAQLAALVCTDDRYLKAEGIPLSAIKACVPVDGDSYDLPMQLKAVEEGPAASYALAFGDPTKLKKLPTITILAKGKRAASIRIKFGDEALQKELSAVTHVAKGKNIPPFLVLHVAGHPETKAQSQRLVKALVEAGVPATAYPAAGKNHTTINADLGLPDDGPTREILTFLGAVLNRQQSAGGSP